MRKILILFSILILTGVIFWYIQKDQRQLQSGQFVSDAAPSAAEMPSVPVGEDVPKANAPEEGLQAMALRIVSEPLIFKAQLSESEKAQAKAKIEEMAALIKDNYNYVNAWLDLGAYRKLIGDYDGAIEAWNFLTLIRPKDFIALHNLGELYGFYLKDYEKAEQNFLKSVNNNPANIDGYIQLATLYEYGYKEKADQVETILLLGIKANPADPNLKIVLGEYYQKIGRLLDALNYFEKALRLNPANKALGEEIEKLKSD